MRATILWLACVPALSLVYLEELLRGDGGQRLHLKRRDLKALRQDAIDDIAGIFDGVRPNHSASAVVEDRRCRPLAVEEELDFVPCVHDAFASVDSVLHVLVRAVLRAERVRISRGLLRRADSRLPSVDRGITDDLQRRDDI